MAYSYHISFDSGATFSEFFPTENSEITWAEYSDEIFLRPTIKELKIGVRLNPTIYATLLSDFFDDTKFSDPIKIKIKKDGVDTYYFRSSISNAEIDTEKNVFTLTPESDDEYQDILDIYDISTLYSNMTATTVDIKLWDSPTGSYNSISFTSFSESTSTVVWGFSGAVNQYARFAITGSFETFSGDQYKIMISGASGGGTIRLVDASFNLVSNEVTVSDGLKTLTATGNGRFIEFYVAPGGSASGTFTYINYFHAIVGHGNNLHSFIDGLLSDLGLSQTVKSTFLFGDALPTDAPASIETYLTAHPTNDYVRQSTRVFNDNIALISMDFTGTAGLDLTLKELMSIIKIKLRSYWYIDSEGYLRIEHQRYFRDWESQLDITAAAFQSYKPEIDTSIYTYDKSDVYNQVELDEGSNTSIDFIKAKIIYDLQQTSPKVEKITPPKITTDYAVYSASSDDRANFFLCSYDMIGSTRAVSFGLSQLDVTRAIQNKYLSWPYLLVFYWKYFGNASVATINNGTTLNLTHVKEILKQNGIKFYYSGNINYYQPVTVARGTGWIKRIILSLDSGFYTLDVGFDPYNL